MLDFFYEGSYSITRVKEQTPLSVPQVVSLQDIVSALQRHKSSKYLGQPFDLEAQNQPTYPRVIKQPMDLGKIQEKVRSGGYDSLYAFKEDFQLLAHNSRVFHGRDHDFTKEAVKLGDRFVEIMSKYPYAATSPAGFHKSVYRLADEFKTPKLESLAMKNYEATLSEIWADDRVRRTVANVAIRHAVELLGNESAYSAFHTVLENIPSLALELAKTVAARSEACAYNPRLMISESAEHTQLRFLCPKCSLEFRHEMPETGHYEHICRGINPLRFHQGFYPQGFTFRASVDDWLKLYQREAYGDEGYGEQASQDAQQLERVDRARKLRKRTAGLMA
ncbi:putative bromodomain-containing protein [Septoria linicola]|nr:putative bromodomain-containing protein [Septoria linicola]